MTHCENCGCKKREGICTNCHEELYIMDYQSEFIDFPLSDEFIKKAKEQKEEIRRNNES